MVTSSPSSICGIGMLFRIYGSCEKFQESIVSNTEISEELRSVPLFSFPPK